jgi:hypothetical protein
MKTYIVFATLSVLRYTISINKYFSKYMKTNISFQEVEFQLRDEICVWILRHLKPLFALGLGYIET